MYTSPPTEAEAALFGLTVEEASMQEVEVWPDNMRAVEVFACLCTQWRVGPAGATGLDYAAIPAVLQMLDVSPSKQLLADLRVMEDEALATMRKK